MRRLLLGTVIAMGVVACSDSTSPSLIPPIDATSPDLGTMNVGDVRVLTYAQAQSGLTIPATLASAQYLVVSANVAGDTGTVPFYTVLGNHENGTSTVPRTDQLSVPLLRPQYTKVGGTRGAQFEAKLRQYERSKLHLSTMSAAAPSSLRRLDNVPIGTVPSVGQQYQFNVPGASGDLCTNFSTVTATVEAVSQHAIIVVDNRSLSSGFTTATYDSVANEFDTFVYPTEVSYFGTPTDIDQNGHIFILYTPAVNVLTPRGTANTTGFVGGFTFAGDFFSNTTENAGGCPESNQGEIFYLIAPDPSGVYGNVFSVPFVQEQTRVTMAHEFQHAINSGTRIVKGYPTLESAWLDESLSSLAEDAVGRVELNVGDLQTLTLSSIQNMDTTMFNTFFSSNFTRTKLYVQRPDTIGAMVTDTREEQDLAAFGAGWAWLRYTVDWYSNGSPRALTTRLVAGPDTGSTNMVSSTGAPLDSLLAHWLITMYTDGQGIPNLAAQYNYKTYNLRAIISALCLSDGCHEQAYLPVTPLGDGTASVSLGVPSTSADYFVTSLSNGSARTIKVTNAGGSPATSTSGRLYIVRLQ